MDPVTMAMISQLMQRGMQGGQGGPRAPSYSPVFRGGAGIADAMGAGMASGTGNPTAANRLGGAPSGAATAPGGGPIGPGGNNVGIGSRGLRQDPNYYSPREQGFSPSDPATLMDWLKQKFGGKKPGDTSTDATSTDTASTSGGMNPILKSFLSNITKRQTAGPQPQAYSPVFARRGTQQQAVYGNA